MDHLDFVPPQAIDAHLRAASKRALLQQLAVHGATVTGMAADRILEALVERERLGTTGLGGGVAIPHARLPGLKSVVGVFARLPTPVDFDAIDRQPVDLVLMLLAPSDAGADHLKALAKASRLFRNAAVVRKLRGAESADGIYALLSGFGHSEAA
jgi:PTS system nitrogen regulatory IIA component